MKNFSHDPDYLDILSAWHGTLNISPKRRKELLDRLGHDQALRAAVAKKLRWLG